MSTTTIARYPSLEEAFRLMGASNGLTVQTNVKTNVVPQEWLLRFEDAEEIADRLKCDTLDTYLNEEQLGEEAEGDENALEYLADGEPGIVDMLVEACDAQALHEVLNAAFEGELCSLVYEEA